MKYSDYKNLNDKEVIQPFCIDNCDQLQYVGWEYTKENDPKIAFLFSQKNIDYLSETITEALEGIDPENRSIIIPDNRICEVLNAIYKDGTRPNIGDIQTRYAIPSITTRNDIKEINNQVIAVIVSYIKNEIGMTENNKSLNIWDATVLGSFSKLGLRAHPPIKIRNRRPMPMYFFQNY